MTLSTEKYRERVKGKGERGKGKKDAEFVFK
jgi:hypothetical protein